MVEVRRAVAQDASELVRLRKVMFTGASGSAPVPGPWQDSAEETLRARLSERDESLAAFVVDAPRQRGVLAACVVGVVEQRLAGPENPRGDLGYVFNVATDPDHRRRGYARACMEVLLAWYRDRGVVHVDLTASREGEPLYTSLGFVRRHDPVMRLVMSPPTPV